MRSRSIFILIVLLTLVLPARVLAGDGSMDNTLAGNRGIAPGAPDSLHVDPMIVEGMELIFHERYDMADSLFDIVVEKNPDHPVGYFFKGLVAWRRSYIIKEYKSYDDEITSQLKRAIKKADMVLKEDKENAEALFYRGGSYGFIGTLRVRDRSWIRAGIYAIRGIRSLQKAYESDPRMYDIYYGLGLYHTVAGNAPGLVRLVQKLIPIPEADAAQGMKYLQLAHEKGTYTRTAALAFLGAAYIYYDDRFQDAIDILEPLVNRYPRCIDFWLSLANGYFYQGLTHPDGKWEKLLEIVADVRKEVHGRKIELLPWWEHKLLFIEGYACYSLGEHEKAHSILTEYSKIYPKKGSYLTSLGELTLGKLADLSGNRKDAVKHYKKALKLEHFGNLEVLAKHYIDEPFTGETPEWRFIGMMVDLPNRT